ncbi:MAG: FliI/YscN family ATPase [Planctomycetes bacterium]|nr:FliI/YscN family ATPase [Planctomycetota bacterium]
MSIFQTELEILDNATSMRLSGRVSKIIGLIIECEGLSAPVGSICSIQPSHSNQTIETEVVGFREDRLLLMPFGEMRGIKRNDIVNCKNNIQSVSIGMELLGRIVDARGNPIDNGPTVNTARKNFIYAAPPKALSRQRISKPLATGVKCIDGLSTCGRGQRVGLFSGSGVGKSVLMGMVARNTEAQVNVICLVGERGREVREFIEKDLGKEGLKRSIVVVATSDEPALLRVKAPFTASAIAEFFRDMGMDVLLLMDSITRMAIAQREIGLSIGEPPATKGFTPSVFAMMPKLLERAGTSDKGSITGIYTVLVESDDINEPVADTARSILDGHIWLSRDIATKGHYPAIDPLMSVSRLMIEVVSREHREAAVKIKSIMATYRNAEDLINIGAYVHGSNPDIDHAIKLMPKINAFLKQDIAEKTTYEKTVQSLLELAGQ